VLSDLGADVWKLEDPGPGDYLRDWAPLTSPDGGQGMFAALNRGKRSLAFDLKAPGGPALLHRLCDRADVLVEGFRPGVLERFGLSPRALCEAHPRLVVCSISGFGQSGPWSQRAGHDITYLALAGALARCGSDPARPPELPGVQLADLMGGAQTALVGILAALFERERTGKGRAVDVSMTEGAMGFLLPHLGAVAAGERPAPRGTDLLSGSHPCYRVYPCADGGAIAIGPLEPKFWERFCAAVDRPSWRGRPFDLSLVAEVEALFLTRTRGEWSALLGPVDCCAEPVLEPHELAGHPLHASRDLFVESGGLRHLRSQPALVPTAELPRGRAPGHGEQTEELLREAGLAEAELQELRRDGVIA
jgi:crotonobetainyl-CoA:carnitine CoA-transferase CaiB-like acyl-CoA transferase